jgi:lipoprotein-anchoring transpeptidase ErfK/SrfK
MKIMTKSRSFLQTYRRPLAWGSVALVACMLPFFEALGERTLAQDLPRLRPLQPKTEHLRLKSPTTVTEGQPFDIHLTWQNLPAGARVEETQLHLYLKDLSYDGSPHTIEKALRLGSIHQAQTLTLQSPGVHTLEIRDAENTLWAQQTLKVEPFPASVFPKHQADYPGLSQNPADYHIWVNLHHDGKAPQRQYAQITYKGKILERLLVSSGAAGHDTPLGDYKLGFKDYYPRSARYDDTPMPFWSAINVNGNEGEYGFHALDSGGYLYLLGKPASHGCIRLSRLASLETHPKTGEKYWGDRGGARWIYDRIPQNTPVSIFKHPVESFAFEDYPQYLAREAQQYIQRNKKNETQTET